MDKKYKFEVEFSHGGTPTSEQFRTMLEHLIAWYTVGSSDVRVTTITFTKQTVRELDGVS